MKLQLERVVFLNLIAKSNHMTRLPKRVGHVKRSVSVVSARLERIKEGREARSFWKQGKRFKQKLLVNCINIPTESGKNPAHAPWGFHNNRNTPIQNTFQTWKRRNTDLGLNPEAKN